MARNEKETRIQLINPKLRKAGWKVLNKDHIIEKGVACIETPVFDMPKTLENQNGNGFVDYVLFGDDGKALAVIEAKKSVVNADIGRMQACLYADCLEKVDHRRPIIYWTNGYQIFMKDGIYPTEREVFGFHTKEELEYMIQKRNYSLKDCQVDANICGRYYQQDAIEEVLNHLKSKNTRSLIVLATGTGKTRVSCALSEIFIRNNYVKRILFLADRKNLVRQAKEECFEKFLPSVPMALICDGQKEGEESKARIVFSTYQSMLSIIKDTEKCPYGIGHFDLIIVDEAHRSLFNKYGEIFDYFDSLMIGLTATPRDDIHKSTYRVFKLESDMPNYEYDVVKGVKDGYLTYYRAFDRTPSILKNGLKHDELTQEEKEQYEDLFTDETGEYPPSVDGELFYSVITNKDTIREVLKTLMEEGLKVDCGDKLGKTIIFARDHNHATLIKKEFDDLFPELCMKNNPNGVDYCVVIDNKIPYNEVLQREFKNKQDIRIVVSVDMMDTGVDIPEVVNLVFFKKVLSKIKFWQMIGRGTRLCKDIHIKSPSKAFFDRLTNDSNMESYDDKQGFYIFDICNVFPYFKLNPDGEINDSDTLSLNQKIFMQKVALYKAMQFNYGKLVEEDRKFYEQLRQDLVNEIKSLNKNMIGVQKNYQYVEKYSKVGAWLNFNQDNFVEVKQHIARNIQGEIDLESARIFDHLCYKFSASRFMKNKDFVKATKTIYSMCNYLLNAKKDNDEVKKSINTLNYIVSDEFIQDSSVSKVDECRLEVRDLMRYIERDIVIPIISDFDDKIVGSGFAIEDDVNLEVSVDDFKTLEEKTIFYIQSNPSDLLVHQIQNLIKPTEKAIRTCESEIIKFVKEVDDYTRVFEDDEALVRFVRQNIEFNPDAINEFLDKQKVKGFNEMQLAYAKGLIEFISQNGYFSRQFIISVEELQTGDLFTNVEILSLLEDIEKVF